MSQQLIQTLVEAGHKEKLHEEGMLYTLSQSRCRGCMRHLSCLSEPIRAVLCAIESKVAINLPIEASRIISEYKERH